MAQISIGFEMSDFLVVQAVREDCICIAREFVSPTDALIVLASTMIFALAVVRESHWLWWLAGLPLIIVLILGVGWLLAYLWLPRLAKARLAHLPNRHVRFEASESTLMFQTATERLEVGWSELKALKRRPNFWLVCLQSGTRIPIPAERLTEEAVALLEANISLRSAGSKGG